MFSSCYAVLPGAAADRRRCERAACRAGTSRLRGWWIVVVGWSRDYFEQALIAAGCTLQGFINLTQKAATLLPAVLPLLKAKHPTEVLDAVSLLPLLIYFFYTDISLY